MTIVVAFDGSDLARSALGRACSLTGRTGEDIVALTAIPKGDSNYARERGWLEEGDEFALETIEAQLRSDVNEICSTAEFKSVVIGRRPSKGGMANKIRRAAKAENASMVVIGSDNAGRITTALSSVGGGIATDIAYDILIVRS
jgi:nucleotide-binding universal stress UspA family protein